jgi:hypothetical protein
MKILVFLSILTTVSFVQADLCNFHATLIETNTFYLTQPFTKNISLDLSNYKQAFKDLDAKLNQFNSNLEFFDDPLEIKNSEPFELKPYSSDYNAFMVNETVYGFRSFNACSHYNGSLVYLTKQNKNTIASLLKQFGMTKTPFKALPFHSLFSFPNIEVIDEAPSLDHIYSIWNKSPPFLTAKGEIEYPNRLKHTTPPSISTTISAEYDDLETSPEMFSSRVLCLKENNPWDLPENTNKWLELVPTIKSSIALLRGIKNSFDQSDGFLKNLPQNIKKETLNLFKLVLPKPLTNILEFLEQFTSKRNWDKSKFSSFKDFAHFTTESDRLAKFFNIDPKSVTNLTPNSNSFKPLNISHIQWANLLQLDNKQYGISEPILITPISALRDTLTNYVFEAKVHLKIFDRDLDKYTIYSARPNIANDQITSVKYVVNSTSCKIASYEAIQPTDCHTTDYEKIKICNQFPLNPSIISSFSELAACGEALFSKTYSPKFKRCPTQSISKPYIYRAQCAENEQSTIFINSITPLQLQFTCDNQLELTRNFSHFPARVTTNCGVSVVQEGTTELILPQSHSDFVQNPIIDYSTIHEQENFQSSISISFEIRLIIYISVVCIIVIVISIIITLICYLAKRPTLESSSSQNSTSPPRSISRAQHREFFATNEYNLS